MKHVLMIALLVLSCGGGAAEQAPPETPGGAETESAAARRNEPAPPATAAPAASTKSEPAGLPTPSTKVTFPPNASVDEAINAVPQGLPRVNINDNDLQKPLMEMPRYESCKVPRSTRVSIRVAVYDGAAVGTDITSKPKSAKIEQCVAGVVRTMSWPKVPSLNTMTFNF
jgi:glucose/arabinose dehydrogenase